jgi:hypothetical protein
VRERPEVFGRLAGDRADAASGAEGAEGAVPRRGNYVRRGEYAELLEPYLEAYPRSRVHLMLLDDLVADRETSLRGLFGFLGVSRRPAGRIQDSHANRFRQRADDGRMQATSYPPMSPATRAVLVEHFGPHNERLGALLGRDLGHWV